MSNSLLSTRRTFVSSTKFLKKLSRLVCLMAFFVSPFLGFGQATLPISNVATTSSNTMPTGFSQSGLGTVYSSTVTPWKFDTQGDYVICNFTGTPGTLTFKLTNNSLSGTYQFDVLQSADGSTYTNLQSITSITSTQSFSISSISASTRYIKWVYTTKATGNVGLGTIGLTSGSTSPTITGSATATAFTTTYGTASVAQTFSVSGAALTADMVATAPTGFEVSRDGGTTYKDTVIFTQSSGTASGSLKVRLKATAPVSGTYNAQNIVLSSTDATSVNIVTSSSGNSVTAKALTITGLSAANKNYDGNTSVSVTGTPAYSGLVNGDVFSVTGTVSWVFADSSVGNNKSLTRTGTYDSPSSNYTVTQPSLTASILALNSPALTAATGATVDAPFDITFTDDVAWRTSISGIKIGASALTNTSYSIAPGIITLSPSASALLQTSGSKTIVVISTGYKNDTAVQTILYGVATKLGMNTQPTAPSTNGGVLATQPKVNILDQYNNITASTGIVSAVADSLTWTLNGTSSVAASAGVSTFSGLTATSTAAVTSAKIIFSSPGLTSVISNSFAIPTPPPANDLCANATSIVVNGGITSGSLIAATTTTNTLTYGSTKTDVWYKFIPDVTGTDTITLTFASATSRDIDIDVFSSATCPTTGAATYISHGSTTTETITGSVTVGNTYYIRVIDWGGATTNGGIFSISVKGPAMPVLLASGSLSEFTSNFGTATAGQSVAISGTKLLASILATAPTGFEVSRDGGNTYKDTVIFAQTGGNVNGTLFIRLKATAAVGLYDSKNIVLSSNSAISVNITTTSSGNIVSAVAPSAPRVDTAVAGNAQATVFFTAPTSNGGSSVTGYTVTSNPDGISINGTTSPITITGLTNGTAYTFTVVATNVAGNSLPSNTSNSVTPTSDPVVPGIPTIGTATAGNGQATIAFTAPASDGGSSIISYTAVSNPGNITATVNQSESGSITVTGLTNGTAYTFTVYATNSIGNSLSSSASNSVTPTTVSSSPSINSITIGNKQLSVLFTAPTSNGGAAITNYKYSINGGTSFIECSPAQTTSPIVITGLTNGTSYDVQILAVNAVGDGTASSTVSAIPATKPGAPAITSITPGNTQLSVAFTAPASDSGSAITNYKYSTNGGTSYVACSPAQTSSPIVITGLTNASSYTVKILAVNAMGDGTASASMTGTPRKAEPSAQPSSLVLSSVATTSMNLAFTAAAATPDGYLVIRSTVDTLSALPADGTLYTAGTSFGGGTVVSSGSTTSAIANTALSSGTIYYYFVFAYNNATTLRDYLTANPLTGNAITLSAAPVPTASNVAGFSFDITWPAVSSANSYVLSVSTNSTFTAFVAGYDSINITALTQSLTGLQAGSTYYFRVKAINASGSSSYGTGNATTLALTAPVANDATSITSTSFIANWDSVLGASSYRLDVSTNPNFLTGPQLSENFSGVTTTSTTDRSGVLNNYTQTSGWTGTYVYDNTGQIKLGSGSNLGSLITPALDLTGSNGACTFTFDLLKYSGDNTIVQVFVSVNNGATYTQVGSDISAPSTITTQTINITEGSSTTKIKIAAKSASNNRYYLDNINITSPNTNLPNYNNLTVNDRSQLVSGLTNGTTYYYRVRAYSSSSTSANSNVRNATTITSAPPVLTAQADATVDNSFNVTFADDSTWRNTITGITIGGVALPASSYVLSNPSQITFTPSASALLQSAGTKTIVFVSSLYSNDTLTQAIAAGASTKLGMNTQPTAPASNGATLTVQPKINVVDQYGNLTASTATVTANVGSGVWMLNGTTAVSAVNGVATFSDLKAASLNAVSGATIIFTASGLTSITSSIFNIPAPANLTLNATDINSVGFTANWTKNPLATAYQLGVSTSATFNSFVPGYDSLIVQDSSKIIAGLQPATVYYYRVRAINASGTGVYASSNTTTSAISAPIADTATSITSTSFIANWDSVSGASSYRLDVSKSSTFGTITSATLTENFETGMPTSYPTSQTSYTLSSGSWSMLNVMRNSTTSNVASGIYSAQVKKDVTANITSPLLNNVGNVSFSCIAGTVASGGLKIQKSVNGGSFVDVQTFTIATTFSRYTCAVNDSSNNVVIRFVSTAAQTLYLDSITISYNNITPSYITGYQNISVSGHSQLVSGLRNGTTYYYRVRAYSTNSTSANSNTINLTTDSTILNSPTLVADTTATVDNPFSVNFIEDPNWRDALTGISLNGVWISDSAYSKTNEGQIVFSPSFSTLLQTPGNKSLVFFASGYTNDTLAQVIKVGAPNKLAISQQPIGPVTNGAVLATQPKVSVRDQYGNQTTTTLDITAAAEANTWTLNGTVTTTAVNGIASFAGLTASSSTALSNAKIIFSSLGLTSVTSNTFSIPPPPPANDSCSGAVFITANTGATVGTFVSATPMTGSTYKDVFYSFTPLVIGSFTITINGFSVSGDRDLYVYNTCPSTYSTSTNVVASGTATSSTVDSVKTTFTAGTTYKIMVQDYAGAGGTFNITITGPAAYFSKATGNLNALSTWGSNPDGSGTSPISFTAANQSFIVKNNATPTIDSSWIVSGTGSKVVLGDSVSSINFTIPAGLSYTGNLDIASNATLTLLNATNSTITFGKLSSGSTVDFASNSSQTIPAGNYWNLTNSGNGRRALASSGTIGIAGTYTPTTDSITTTGSTVNFNGTTAQTIPASNYNNITTSNISGCTTAGNVTFGNILNVNQQLTVGSASTLMMLPGDSVIIGAGKNLTVSATGKIQNNSTRIFNFNSTGSMTMNGVYVHNANSQTIPSSTYTTYGTGSIIKVGDGASNITTVNPILPATAYDVVWNCPSQTQTNIFISSTTTSLHDLTIINTGTGYIADGLTSIARTLNISGNLILQGGNLHIIGNGTNTADQTLNISGNLTVSGGKLNLNSGLSTSNSILNLSGNLIHNGGSITASNTSTGKGAIVFKGTLPQSTDSISTSSLVNVTVNNPAGVTLNNDLAVSGTLTFTSGKINTGANKLISTGTIVGGGSGWVIGNLQKNITSAGVKTFEIGGTNYYRPVSINVTTLDVAGDLTASVSQQDNNHPNLAASLISPNKSIKRYFTLTPGNGLSALYDAVFNFNLADQPAGGLDSTKLFVGNYNGTDWSYPTVGAATATSIQISGTRLFGDFSMGEKSTPVSVTLIADSITTTSARLNGTVNDNGYESTAGFDYGTSISYGNTVVANPQTILANAGTTSVSAIITSLSLNTQYKFRVNATNTMGTSNSISSSFYTLASVPGAPVVENPTPTTLNVTIDGNGNPNYTLFAIHETTTNQYLQTNGILGANPVWQTTAIWGTKTVTELTANTTYTFEVQAKNGDNVLTAFGISANGTTIERLSQTISSIAASVTKTYGDTAYSIATTATSGLTVTYSSSDTTIAKVSLNGTVSIVGAGSATLSAAQSGNSIYSPAPVISQLLTVNKAGQTIAFGALASKTTVDADFALTATTSAVSANSLMVFTSSDTSIAKIISGNIVRIVSAGSVNITASNAGNNNYLAATSVSQVLNIASAIAKWTFEGITSTNTGKNIIVSAGSAAADLGAQPSGSLFSAYHKSSSTIWSNPNGNGSLKSVLSTYWDTADYYQFKVNTSSFSGIKVSFDMMGSNTGPSTFKIQYSTDGTNFTTFGNNFTVTNDSWSSTQYKSNSLKSFDLSTIDSINNRSNVYFRIVNVNTTPVNSGSTFGSGGTNRIDNFTVTGNSLLQLNVKAFLEGFYIGNSTMTASLHDLNLSNDATATDSLTVNLWSPDSVSNINANPSFSLKGILHTNGTMGVYLPKSTIGSIYYIALKHRNSIETWSATPIKISESNYYNFTDSASKAYGDGINAPMKDMGNGEYALYSGNTDQDRTIDINDMSNTENDAFNFAYGYNNTDSNGDGASDALDMQIIENNATLQIYTARPQ